MNPRRDMATIALAVALGIGTLVACGTAAQDQPASPSTVPSSGGTSVSSGGPSPAPTEVNPAGDIPDQQAFVTYHVPGSTVSVKVPEGWSRSTSAASTSFTDKLNSVQISTAPAASAPTMQSVTAIDVPALKSALSHFVLVDVTTVTRPAGPVVLLTYQVDSVPNSVTGKVVRDEVERYTFFANGTRVDLTLAGPQGSDNIDPWRVVTDSVTL